MKNILLVGHGGCYNRGCEAIVRSTVCLLRKEFGSVKITISSFDYENDRLIDFGHNVTIIPASSRNQWKRFSKDWTIRQFLRIFAKDRIWELEYSPIVRHLKNADLVLSVGGDNYTADYGEPSYYLNLNKLVRKFRKKLIIWAASVGPFPENGELQGIISNLKTVNLITVRETKSLKYLKGLGVSENVRLVADPAFLLMSDTSPVEFTFRDIEAPVLGFNVSPILANYTDKLGNEEIVKECTLFLKKVIKDMQMYILLIPHVTKSMDFNNDYNFMEKIYDNLKDTKMIKRISAEYNAMQIKGIISTCQFFIGARTHSTIAALSAGIPTLSIGYSVKSKGINEDLFGHNDFVIDAKDLSARLLFGRLIQLYSAEKEIKNLLSIRIPVFKALANKNMKYFKEILQ